MLMNSNLIKKSFTLLEIIITISLLTTCFSVIGIKINSALYSHKFKNNIKRIDDCFDFCKKMAKSNGADIYLKLFQKNMKIYIEIGTDQTMGFFEKGKKSKDQFDDMSFLFDDKNQDEMEIIFSSTGEVFPKGKFIFSDKKNKFKENKTI
jgi:hypothetical protein